jgi:hypothetical protein
VAVPDHDPVMVVSVRASPSSFGHRLGRVLASNRRLVMTWATRRGATPVWTDQARAAGLTVEHVDERPAEPALWERLHPLWLAHADDLRSQRREDRARNMLREAHQVLPALPGSARVDASHRC